jgi:hypothetical protein
MIFDTDQLSPFCGESFLWLLDKKRKRCKLHSVLLSEILKGVFMHTLKKRIVAGLLLAASLIITGCAPGFIGGMGTGAAIGALAGAAFGVPGQGAALGAAIGGATSLPNYYYSPYPYYSPPPVYYQPPPVYYNPPPMYHYPRPRHNYSYPSYGGGYYDNGGYPYR